MKTGVVRCGRLVAHLRAAIPIFAFLSLLHLLCGSAIAQTPDPVPAPVDSSEAGGIDVAPLRIGAVTLSGSAWIEALADAGDHLNESNDTFRVRRARIGLAGNLTPKIGWSISGEFTAQPTLRNAFVIVRFTDQFNVRVGQAVPPNGLERATSPLAGELIDRSLVTRRLTVPLDTGVTVMNASPYRGWLSYAVSAVNGTGLNRPDDNDAKDLVGRLTITPRPAPGLSVVASGAAGKSASGSSRLSGIGAEYDVAAFKVLVEGLRRTYQRLPTSRGIVAIAAYRIRPLTVTPHFRMIEFAVRYSVLDDPSSATGDAPEVIDEDDPGGPAPVGFIPSTVRELQAGGNYHVNPNVKFMLNVVVPLGKRSTPDLSLIARMQVVF